jgi:hypothetical protein
MITLDDLRASEADKVVILIDLKVDRPRSRVITFMTLAMNDYREVVTGWIEGEV